MISLQQQKFTLADNPSKGNEKSVKLMLSRNKNV